MRRVDVGSACVDIGLRPSPKTDVLVSMPSAFQHVTRLNRIYAVYGIIKLNGSRPSTSTVTYVTLGIGIGIGIVLRVKVSVSWYRSSNGIVRSLVQTTNRK